jgi:hypothetical protein
MADAQYLEWFEERFRDVDTLTWCSTMSFHDVLAAYGMRAEQAQPAGLAERNEFRLLAGPLGSGMLVIQPTGCPADEVLASLAQQGPCLSVQWSDSAPPGITYLSEGRVVTYFDPFDWEFHPIPDYDSVVRWIAATPAGQAIWEEDWGLATLITAEALCQGAVDEEWVRAAHIAVP